MDSLRDLPKAFGHQDQYRVVSELGRGAFAIVFKAYQQTLDRYVAIKVLRSEVVHDDSGLQRFQREARAAARLGGHPHIVAIYDYGEQAGRAYLVLELVEGETLEQRLAEPIPPAEADRIITAVASALDHAHANQLVHRDVKPANVLLSADGRVVLSDFGIARLLDSTSSLTGTMIGTPEYMSPEQVSGGMVDARSDIYSLGVMVYRIFSGAPPFQGGVVTILHKHVYEQPPPMSSAGWPVPPGIEPIVQRALAKAPADRYASAGELAADLSRVLRSAPAAEATQRIVDDDPPTVMQSMGGPASPVRVSPKGPPTGLTGIVRSPTLTPRPPLGPTVLAEVHARQHRRRRRLVWGLASAVGLLLLVVGVVVATSFFQAAPQVSAGPTPVATPVAVVPTAVAPTAGIPTAIPPTAGVPTTAAAAGAPVSSPPATPAEAAHPADHVMAPAGSVPAVAGAASSPVPAPVSGAPPSLATARNLHTVTRLDSGKILVAGGRDGSTGLATAELYDPASNTWVAAGTMSGPRFRHTATLLPGGKVLVVGGQDSDAGFLSTAELYDPIENAWSSAPPMSVARASHSATVLKNGKVLVAGGYNGTAFHNTAELYDPAEKSWHPAASMAAIHVYHTATLLPSGTVLVAGGFGSTSEATAEQYDAATDSWSPAGSMAEGRVNHTATLLASGKVLVVGGGNSAGGGTYLATTELYDPATNSWSGAAPLADARAGHVALSLNGDRVLVAGGRDKDRSLASAELFDPATSAWTPAGTMASARWLPAAAPMPDGRILMVGGRVGNSSLTTTEAYDPKSNGWLAEPQRLKMDLMAQNGSGITGTATFTELGDGRTRVEVRVTGAGSGPQPSHIHEGTCAQLNPAPKFPLTPVTNGVAVTDVNATLQQLTSEPHAIHLHKSADELPIYVACADTKTPG